MSKSKYPLCEAAGLEVVPKKKIDELLLPQDYVRASEVERMLSEAPTVHFEQIGMAGRSPAMFGTLPTTKHTHTARVVCIEPIKKKSREEQLEDILIEILESEAKTNFKWTSEHYNVFGRARKLLEGK